MRILVIGSGGREHAIVHKLKQSNRVSEIYCVPGNPGIAELAECVSLDITDNQALYEFATKKHIDMTVVGPEIPLSNGVVDYFTQRGLKIFGPTQAAARLETSKAFAKLIMEKYNIPTAFFKICKSADEAKAYIRQKGAPIVVKADGLAAGKGVIVALTTDEALQAVDEIMKDKIFGSAGNAIVLEEYLEGEEASLLAFSDGKTVKPMVAAQDHKRVYDNDEGPNTGGMGAYAPAPVMTEALINQTVETILKPVISAMAQEGTPYKGCIYAGLMITAQGPKVIEFNARFGDPETQVVLPLLKSDFVDVLSACIDNSLADCKIEWKNQHAVCAIIASEGYPGSYRKGEKITGVKNIDKDITVYHAGTAVADDQLYTFGGRVLGVTAVGDDLYQAVEKVYRNIEKIHFNGMHYRKDIAQRALKRLPSR